MPGENRIGAGYRFTHYGVANSDGKLQGNTNTAATNGTIQPLVRLLGSRTIPVGLPERDKLPVSGDDQPLVTFSFPGEGQPNGILELSVRDQGFEALIQGTKEETIGNLRAGAYGPGGASSPTMMLLLQRESKKYEGATKGSKAWEALLIAACEISPLGATWTQRAFEPYRYEVVVSKAARALYGATFTELDRGTTELDVEPVISDNPIMIEGGFGNAAATAYTLSYTPKSPSASTFHVYLDGVKQAYTTNFSVSGTTLTFVVAPGSGVHIGVMYEVDETNL